jgi:hypothetical protein
MVEWRIQDFVAPDAYDASAEHVQAQSRRQLRGTKRSPIAVRLHDITVHDNKKWFALFGGADIRIDSIIVQGNVMDDNPASAYAPSTLRFPGVKDDERLATDGHGLLAYFGAPRHFLDLSIMVSRDTKDSDDLSKLIGDFTTSKEFSTAATSLLALTAAAPAAAAVIGAVAAATTIANFAYRVVREVSGTTIGFYRGNRLEYPDNFGLGRNPDSGAYRENEMSFWYEVVKASKKPVKGPQTRSDQG